MAKYRSNYVPKKRKVNYKIVVPFIIILASVVGVLIANFSKKDDPKAALGYSICNMSPADSQRHVVKSINDKNVDIKSVGFFSNALSFYRDDVVVGKNDSLVGETMILRNVCGTNHEDVIFLTKGLDGQVQLENLAPGFYEVRITEGFERVRLTSKDKIDMSTTSLTLHNEAKGVRVVADKDLFSYGDLPKLDKNYVFVEVKNQEAAKTNVDVVLDPNGMFKDKNGFVSSGLVFKDYNEAQMMYRLAFDVKEALSAKGYRVGLSRGQNEVIQTHGEGGRLFNAYKNNAKYYIHLAMVFDTRSVTKGATIITSNFTTNHFADTMLSALKQTNLPLYDFGIGTPGLTKTGLVQGLDNNAILRESGGKYTGAGTINDTYRTMNKFAKDSNQGMQALAIEVGYISNPETLNVWNQEYQSLVDAFVLGIEKQLN